MFWRRNKEDTEEAKEVTLDLPPLEQLENWVLQLIIKLDLKKGEFTFLPGYSGVILFIKNQGISWIPYSEIKDALGEVQKNKLLENTATLGGIGAAATSGLAIPAILVHRFLKGSYRIIAKPSPGESMGFLLSLIEKVIIEEKRINESLLNTFEQTPYKENETYFSSAVITIKRKFLDNNASTGAFKLMKGVKTFLLGQKDPIFAIPPQSDVRKFATILETHGITVEHIVQESDNLIEENEEYRIEEAED